VEPMREVAPDQVLEGENVGAEDAQQARSDGGVQTRPDLIASDPGEETAAESGWNHRTQQAAHATGVSPHLAQERVAHDAGGTVGWGRDRSERGIDFEEAAQLAQHAGRIAQEIFEEKDADLPCREAFQVSAELSVIEPLVHVSGVRPSLALPSLFLVQSL